MSRSSWRKCDGWWPQGVRYLCHHGPAWLRKWAKSYAADRVLREMEDEHMQAVLSLTLQTGGSVYGTVDAEGRLQMTVEGDPETVYVIRPENE